MRYQRTLTGFALALSLMSGMLAYKQSASAQGGIQFGSTTVENFFPSRITFLITVSSVETDIVEAEFFYARKSEISSQSMRREKLDIEVGRKVVLEYTWDTSGLTVPPSMPIAFYWRVKDSAGNVAQSEESFIRYDDTRYDWQVQQNPSLAVWWHDKTPGFGQRVYKLAVEAVEHQRQLFNADISVQIRIIIYNHPDEFNAWHSVATEWVGGQAFPDYGITTQIVHGNVPDDYWLRSVIPHEISHLFFAQVTYNPIVNAPYWLDEGIAQYHEHSDYGYQLSLVWGAAANGDLIPLSSLQVGFGSYNEERVLLAYEEALSAVLYMVEAFGERSVATLLTAYREGLSNDEAFQRAFRWTLSEFEANWASWLGVPDGMYATPTAWPKPTFRPSPTMRTFATKDPNPPTTTPTPSPAATLEREVTLTATPVLEEIEPRDFCPAMVLMMPVMLLAFFKPLRESLDEKANRSHARG